MMRTGFALILAVMGLGISAVLGCDSGDDLASPEDSTPAHTQAETSGAAGEVEAGSAAQLLNFWHRTLRENRESMPAWLASEVPAELPVWEELSEREQQLLSAYEGRSVIGKLLINAQHSGGSRSGQSAVADSTPLSRVLEESGELPASEAVVNPGSNAEFGDVVLELITQEQRGSLLEREWASPMKSVENLYLVQVHGEDRIAYTALTGLGSTTELSEQEKQRIHREVTGRSDGDGAF